MIAENLYYTDYYKNHWLKYGILFENKYFKEEKKSILNDNYYIVHKKYLGFIHNKDIIGYDRSLYNTHNNSLIYHYKSDDSRIFKLINLNNNQYFIFNRDLSGFSILNLNNKDNEFNFYYNKPIYYNDKENGIIVFIDLEYLNDKMLFYAFYLSKEDNGTYKRVFDYILFNFSDNIFTNQNEINLTSIRKIIFDKYNHNLYSNYSSYFKEGNIIVEDSLNKKIFTLTNDDFYS